MDETMIWQEFYCTISGGGCGKYFTFRLNPKINYVVEIVCPNCNHKHQRRIMEGKVSVAGRSDTTPKEQIYAQKSSVTDQPRTRKFEHKTGNERDGALISSPEDLSDSQRINNNMLMDRWFEIYGRK
jgi:hypothetical protein